MNEALCPACDEPFGFIISHLDKVPHNFTCIYCNNTFILSKEIIETDFDGYEASYVSLYWVDRNIHSSLEM